MELPEETPTTDNELLELASMYIDICGTIPHPYELTALPRTWLENIALFRTGVQYYMDLPKRPQTMRRGKPNKSDG